jgi:hypothetical protein
VDRAELLRQLEDARLRVTQAKAEVEIQRSVADSLRGHDDFDLADSKIDMERDRLRLRMAELNELEQFLRISKADTNELVTPPPVASTTPEVKQAALERQRPETPASRAGKGKRGLRWLWALLNG